MARQSSDVNAFINSERQSVTGEDVQLRDPCVVCMYVTRSVLGLRDSHCKYDFSKFADGNLPNSRVGYCSDDVDGFGVGFTTHQFCLLLSIPSERVNYDILQICGVCLM